MSQTPSNVTIGVFSKQDIEEAIDRSQLILNASKKHIQACSYDMRIGTIFRDGEIVKENGSKLTVKPGEIISIFTLEELELPNDIMATVFAINEQSSRGFLVLNPGHVDPGFKGPLTVQALNLRKVPLVITQGAPIFTVIFEQLPHSTTSPYNKNISRDEREREYNEKNVEQAPRNIAELVVFGKDSPFVTKQEVREIVQGHWMSWLSFILALVAALTGVISVFMSTVNNNKNINRQSQPSTNISKPNK